MMRRNAQNCLTSSRDLARDSVESRNEPVPQGVNISRVPRSITMNRIPTLTVVAGIPVPLARFTRRLPRLVPPCFVALLIANAAIQTAAADEPENAFLGFVKSRAIEMRGRDEAPASLEGWQKRRCAIRKRLLTAWGGFPQEPTPLNPKPLGTLERDGYHIEKVAFQTMPDVWMTASRRSPAHRPVAPANRWRERPRNASCLWRRLRPSRDAASVPLPAAVAAAGS